MYRKVLSLLNCTLTGRLSFVAGTDARSWMLREESFPATESILHFPVISKEGALELRNQSQEINPTRSVAAIHATAIVIFILQVFNCDELKLAGLR
jgi:hypothetical protein